MKKTKLWSLLCISHQWCAPKFSRLLFCPCSNSSIFMRISRVVLYLTDKPTHRGQTEQQRQLTSDCLSLPTMPQLPGGEADPGTACASHNSLPERGVPCKISKHIKKQGRKFTQHFAYSKKTIKVWKAWNAFGFWRWWCRTSHRHAPVHSQACRWVVVESVQNLRTQLLQVFMQVLALQLDTQLHGLQQQRGTSANAVKLLHTHEAPRFPLETQKCKIASAVLSDTGIWRYLTEDSVFCGSSFISAHVYSACITGL